MFKLFKKKRKKNIAPQLLDQGGIPINEGDEVLSLRYDLGKCKVELDELHFYYVSIKTEQKISYTRMIDAITGYQKVEKIS